MNPDPLDNNVARLVRESTLPLDDSRQRRARERFLRTVGDRPEAVGRRLAVAAAGLLVCGLVFWAATSKRKIEILREPAKERPAEQPPEDVRGSGGDKLLQGTLTSVTVRDAQTQYHFKGTSPLPDGLYFRVRCDSFEESWSAGRIAPVSRESRADTLPLKEGRFVFSWAPPGAGMARLAITAPDSAQDIEMVKSLKIKEADRAWSFEYSCWQRTLLDMLGPQALEVVDLARDLRELLTRVEAACASEEQLLAQKTALIGVAHRLQTRAENFAGTSAYPAALHQIAYTARDLETSIPDFKWVGGKFQGPVSYYTDNKKRRTFRQEPFEFAALRRYLDEAEVIAGREFGLWIVKDSRPDGPKDAHKTLVKELSRRPGVAEFAERLVADKPDARLEEDLRTFLK